MRKYFLAYVTENKTFSGGAFDSLPEKDKIYDFVIQHCDEGPALATIITNEIFEKSYYSFRTNNKRYFIIVEGYLSKELMEKYNIK